MKMKKLLAVLATTAMVFGLVGCGNEAAPASTENTATTTEVVESTEAAPEVTEEAAEPITLRMAWWGSQTRHDRTIAVIELY